MDMKKVVSAALAGVVTLGLASAGNVAKAATPEMEKCYGVAKAGMNDCGVPGGHACAGQSKTDAGGTDWIYVPKGTCDKLVNGSTEPKDS